LQYFYENERCRKYDFSFRQRFSFYGFQRSRNATADGKAGLTITSEARELRGHGKLPIKHFCSWSVSGNCENRLGDSTRHCLPMLLSLERQLCSMSETLAKK
jgi:hypothetical protein